MGQIDFKEEIKLLTIEDIENITGWSNATVLRVMQQPDFPAIKIGKENQVLLESFKEYLSERRDLRGEKVGGY